MNVKQGLLLVLIVLSVSVFASEGAFIEGSVQAGISLSALGNDTGDSFSTGLITPSAKFKLHFFPFSKNDSMPDLGFGLGAAVHYITTTDPDLGWAWLYDETDGEIIHVPLFASFKLRLDETNGVSPFITMQHGYALFFPSANIRKPNDRRFTNDYWGGYCFNLGFGVNLIKGIGIEAGYDMIMSGLSTRYQYGGIWTYWEDNLSTHLITVSAVVTF